MIKEYGSAAVYNLAGEVTTEISIPWAKDAEGRDVETWFTTDGQSLTQHVKHDVEGIVYPVTADPHIVRHWWGFSYYFNRHETNNIAFGSAVGAAIFYKLPFVSVPFGVFSAYASWLLGRGQCLASHQAYSGQRWFWGYTGGNCR